MLARLEWKLVKVYIKAAIPVLLLGCAFRRSR